MKLKIEENGKLVELGGVIAICTYIFICKAYCSTHGSENMFMLFSLPARNISAWIFIIQVIARIIFFRILHIVLPTF